MNELIVKDNNELIIDNNTKLLNIRNREKYTKLVINKKIKLNNLKIFNHVKELIIDYNWNSNYKKILEVSFYKLPFINELEKLIYKNIESIGFYNDFLGDCNYYSLYAPSLTTIEFSENLSNIYSYFLINTKKLETIVFNINNKTKIKIEDSRSLDYKTLIVNNCNLKKFIIKTKYNIYEINLDYNPTEITKIYYSETEGIVIEYNNHYINSRVTINNNIINIKNILTKINDDFINDNCLIIPDYINDIKIEGSIALNEIKSISINFKLINTDEYTYEYIDKYIDKKNIDKIIIRNSTDMSLFQNKEYTTKEFGILKHIYIDNNKLYILFDEILISINKDGNITKKELNNYKELELNKFPSMISDNVTEKDRVINCEQNGVRPKDEENNNNTNLNNYSSYQLEYYTYYKKLLELLICDNEELANAMNIVEKELVKKLEINE